jgi:hypothetical protein
MVWQIRNTSPSSHIHTLMNKLRIISLLIILIMASCTAAPTKSTATLPSTPLPTITLTPTSALPLAEGKILFEKSNGKQFAGTVYGQGETAIILANMSSGGEAQWSPFLDAVDKQKFTIVTFNYLQADITVAAQDTSAVLKKLRESGYKRVICIGASLGVPSCSSIAREPEMVGLVLVAGQATGNSVSKVTYPKLFIAGALDRWAFNTQFSYEGAAEPKTLVLFEENNTHGTSLFTSKDRDQFLTLLLDFVNSLPNP